jgi:hypothetical protein
VTHSGAQKRTVLCPCLCLYQYERQRQRHSRWRGFGVVVFFSRSTIKTTSKVESIMNAPPLSREDGVEQYDDGMPGTKSVERQDRLDLGERRTDRRSVRLSERHNHNATLTRKEGRR